MNIAENVADPGTVEAHHPRRARFVQTKIEPLPFKQRKDIMKKRIVIRKLHHRPRLHHQHMRIETLVPLYQPGNLRLIG